MVSGHPGLVRRVPTRTQVGFTFVEMLVAMIVLGLLAAVMIPTLLGQREKAEGATAQSLLRTGATSMVAVAFDTDGYVGVSPARLAAAEPNLDWLPVPGGQAPRNQVSVTGLGPAGYTLTTTTSSGTTFTLVKNLASSPTIVRSCGPGCDW